MKLFLFRSFLFRSFLFRSFPFRFSLFRVFVLVGICLNASSLLADETLAEKLNDELIMGKLDALELAFNNQETVFFRDNFTSDTKLTIHSIERTLKHSIQFSKKEILEGVLFQKPNELNVLERKDIQISYFNENTQALLTYKMVPKKDSGFRKEKGYVADSQILFQIVKGSVKILKVITQIDLEPNYKPEPPEE